MLETMESSQPFLQAFRANTLRDEIDTQMEMALSVLKAM